MREVHLTRGDSPESDHVLEVAILPYTTYEENLGFHSLPDLERIIAEGDFVDFDAQYWPSHASYYKHKAGIVSGVSPTDKYSKRYIDCLGLAVVGQCSKSEQENISFLTHLTPSHLLEEDGEIATAIREAFDEIKARTVSGTRVAGIFGGQLDCVGDWSQYSKAVSLLAQLTSDALSFEPEIICSPLFRSVGDQEAYLFTKKRELSILRGSQSLRRFDFVEQDLSEPILPSELMTSSNPWVVTARQGPY